MTGQTLGHYRMVREIGAGGMGVVYQAEDTTLGRPVALKILPPELAADDDRRARFAREARAVAALNHPNIVTVHSVEDAGGVHFITMELVKGKTLADVLPPNGVPLSRFFEIAIPLTDAVAAAHQQGIAHRDLKPANVMIGDDGRIKVLDFGLAKTMAAEGHDVAESPTLSATRAQGERVDTRSDIFSLGIVFYELLTGRRPARATCRRASPPCGTDCGRGREPDWRCHRRDGRSRHAFRGVFTGRYQAGLLDRRPDVERLALPSDRPATWADAQPVTSERAFIEFVDVSPDGNQLVVSSDRRGNQDVWVLPAAGGEMTPLTSDPTPDWNPRWSADGNQIAFYAFRSGNRDIWVMPARGGPARQLTSQPGTDWFPTWSPHGQELAFVTQRGGPLEVWRIAATGGEGSRVAVGNSPDWSPDGRWLAVVRDGRLFRVPTDGGEPAALSTGEHQLNVPRVSRDGQFVYYSVVQGPPEHHGLWRVSLNDGSISRVLQLEGRRGRFDYYYALDSRHLYFVWREDHGDIWVMDVETPGGR